MGQKTIPTSLRLNFLKNWNSNWIIDKTFYSKFFYLDITLRQYLKNICNKKKLYQYKVILNKKNDCINIYLHLYNLNLKKKTKEEKRIQINLIQKFKNKTEKQINNYLKYLKLPYLAKFFIVNTFIGNTKIGLNFYKNFYIKNKKKIFYMQPRFYTFINLSYISFYLQNAELLNNYLIKKLTKIPKHIWYLKSINRILKKQFLIFKNCIGYKLQFKGRINGYRRSKKITLKEGKTPLNTINNKIIYDFKEVLTPSGICSLKIWLFFKK